MRTHYLKKWLAALLLPLAAVSANAYDAYVDGIYYNLNSDTKQAEVTSGAGYYSNEIVIPSSFEYDGITYIVTAIGEESFKDCVALMSIEFPSSLKHIGDYAFWGCYNLASAVTIPEGVTSIGNGAFLECSEISSITLPSSLTNIGFAAFGTCRSLTSVTIPEGVTRLENNTFNYCVGLTAITLPASLKYIGVGAFDGCITLTSINIPEGVNTIDSYAFQGCHELQSVLLPSSLTTIEEYAFFECSSLISITIPSSVRFIGQGCFKSCTSLSAVNIQEGIEYMNNSGVFEGCSALTSIQIPGSLKIIGEYLFSGTGLTYVVIPGTVENVYSSAFYGCSNLASVVLHGNRLSEVAFANCTRLKDVFNYGNMGDLSTFEDNTFDGSHIEDMTLHVPAKLFDEAKTDPQWSKFGTIVAINELVSMTIGAAGYATLFCAESNLKIPEGMQAYTGIVNGEWLMLNEVEGKIPAGTAVVLKGEPGTYELQTTTDAAAAAVGNNDLKGTTNPLVADGTQYVLAEKDGVTGFYLAAVGTTIPANKAYIEMKTAGVKGFYFADDATCIENWTIGQLNSQTIVKSSNCQIFNLSGQRIAKMQKGINIINGNKILK